MFTNGRHCLLKYLKIVFVQWFQAFSIAFVCSCCAQTGLALILAAKEMTRCLLSIDLVFSTFIIVNGIVLSKLDFCKHIIKKLYKLQTRSETLKIKWDYNYTKQRVVVVCEDLWVNEKIKLDTNSVWIEYLSGVLWVWFWWWN